MEKENGFINAPNHVISSVNRIKKIHLLIDYQSTLLKIIIFLNEISVRNKVNLITQLIFDSNFSISAITDNCLTIDDSALASQQTPICF